MFCIACHRRAGAPQGYHPKSERWGSSGVITESAVVGGGPGNSEMGPYLSNSVTLGSEDLGLRVLFMSSKSILGPL